MNIAYAKIALIQTPEYARWMKKSDWSKCEPITAGSAATPTAQHGLNSSI